LKKGQKNRDKDDLDEQVAVRIMRQMVLERAKPWCLLDEGVLHSDDSAGCGSSSPSARDTGPCGTRGARAAPGASQFRRGAAAR